MPQDQYRYKKVEAELRSLVQPLPLGSRLPSERNLAATYGCNFLTVRRAFRELVADGTVVRRVGCGTFVVRDAPGVPLRRSLSRIGVLVWQGGDTYSYRVIHALHQAGLAQKAELRSNWLNDYGDDGLARAKLLADDGCSALILPWFPCDRTEEVRLFVERCSLPVILPLIIPGLERNSFEQHQVFTDGLVAATVGLCDYFHKLGYRRIALLGPDSPTNAILQQKLGAYACHVSRRYLPVLCGLVRPGADAVDALAAHWKEYRGELAVIGYDDEHALRFMTAMHKIGLHAPADFQIIGHNNIEAGNYSDPPLTTLSQDFDYLGHWLVKSALALAGGRVDQSTQLPRPRIMVRASCGGSGRIDDSFRAGLPRLDLVDALETTGPVARAIGAV